LSNIIKNSQMKRSILLNAFLVVTAVVGITFTANSQTYVISAGADSRDSVTVGSRAGYRVTPDPTIVALSAIMNPSIFQWVFSSAAPILKPDGTAATLVSPGFYSDTAISGVMPVAAGTITVSVLERSQPKVGTSCDGLVQTLNIDVLPRATVTFTGTGNGACSAQNYNIPVNLTGFGPWTVEYSITYTTFAGVSSPPVTYTIGGGTAATLGTVSNHGATSLNLPILTAQLSSGMGTYAVNIINVFDRFAMKSLDLTLVDSQVGDLPAAAFDLFIYPTPTTSPIKHVKNM
jgi:hypothetical protein